MPQLFKAYLENIQQQFTFYKQMGEKTFLQLPDEALFWQYNEASNSIAIIVKHLWGNMLFRWTNFLTEDGEKNWRDRDGEFEADILSREEMLQKWEEGWACLFHALDQVEPDKLDTLVYIRNMGHTIPEAINRQLGHYAYHIGQIVYIGRMHKNGAWESLSIPKGQSRAYNDRKFKQEKRKAHYTEEYLDSVDES